MLRAPDGLFYAYGTQTSMAGTWVNVQVARSRDLVHWEHRGDALPAKPGWASRKQQFWAPHVIYDDSLRQFFLYYSAEPDSSDGKCIGVATSASATGPYTDSGSPLVCGDGIENIDPMAFDDPRSGKRLLYWGSGGHPIRVRELAADRMHFADEPARPVLFADEKEDYSSLVEGAWVVYRNGAYYLFYSGDHCCRRAPRYAVMVARAASPFGPFEKFARPILERSDAWVAPGHCSVLSDDAGSDWLVYHAMERRYFGPDGARMQDFVPRLMLMERITYQDGWPRIAGDAASERPQAVPAIATP